MTSFGSRKENGGGARVLTFSGIRGVNQSHTKKKSQPPNWKKKNMII